MIIGYLLNILILSSCYPNGLNSITMDSPGQTTEEEHCKQINTLLSLSNVYQSANDAPCFEYTVDSSTNPINKLSTKIDGWNKILYIKNLKAPLINTITGEVKNLIIKLENTQKITGSILANENKGRITNVTIDGEGAIITDAADAADYDDASGSIGGLASVNKGRINNATIKNISLNCSKNTEYIGGLVGSNGYQHFTGEILKSKVINVNISCYPSSAANNHIVNIGGLAGTNIHNSKIESSSIDRINIRYNDKNKNIDFSVEALVGLNYGILKSNSHRNVLINSKETLTY